MQYQKLEKLGSGNYGEVFKVKKDGKDIALKVIDLKDNESLERSAKREVEYLKRISDPCIQSLACYIDSHFVDGKLFLETEFIDGQTLNKFSDYYRLNKQYTNLSRHLYAIIADLIPGIKFLHDKGIIHRDIKPENIMIDKLNYPKLIDIGLACLASDHIICRKCCLGASGTPNFMPYETLIDQISIPKSDIWSLGATIYNCHTGLNVYRDPSIRNLKTLREYVVANPVPVLKSQNDKLNELVNLMLVKDFRGRIDDNGVIEYLRSPTF